MRPDWTRGWFCAVAGDDRHPDGHLRRLYDDGSRVVAVADWLAPLIDDATTPDNIVARESRAVVWRTGRRTNAIAMPISYGFTLDRVRET